MATGKHRTDVVSWRLGIGIGVSRSAKGTPGADSASQRTVGAVGIELWRTGARWRRHAERALARVDLTLAQWLVLDASDALISQMGDAINQNQVAARLEQDRMTVSQVMRALERKGLVDRGPDVLSTAYRIWVTSSGIRAIAREESASRPPASRRWVPISGELTAEEKNYSKAASPTGRAGGNAGNCHI